MSTPYQRLQDLGISDVFIAGYLVLTDDGYPDEDAVKFLLTAEREMDRDPYDSAMQLLNLRKTMRAEKEQVNRKI